MRAQSLLLIEDNEADIQLINSRLQGPDSEFRISFADRLSSGLAALSAERPDVVLLDLYLPDSSGAHTFQAVLNAAGNIPVVILSGHDDEELAVKATRLGAQDYLVKGYFDGRHLRRTLRCAMERKAMVAALQTGNNQHPTQEGYLASFPSREFLRPLTSICGYVTEVLDDPAIPIAPTQRTRLDSALRGARILRSMIEECIASSPVQSEEMRPEYRALEAFWTKAP